MSPLQHLDGGVGWLESRGDVSWTPGTNNTGGGRGNGLFQSASNSTTQMIINEFRFAAAKSIRTSTIILATFNVVAAFATAVGILFDTYCRKKRNDRNFRFRRNGFSFVPAAEVYPLVLSFGIVVQGITFAVAQSTGLDALVGLGCTLIAQMMLPAVFIVPYIQLIFGLEVAIRGLQKKEPFGQRGKWAVTICLTIIGLLILTNFLVANFDRAPNFCLTSLFWFVAHYSVGCFAILTGVASILLVCTVIVFVRLHRSTKIEVTERVAASRMVYYMALAVVSTGFMIPFFFSIAFIDQRNGNSNALTLSMIASVVANVSGLMTGGLYLFLKSNTISTIGPRDKITEYEKRRQKYKIRRYDPDNDDSYDDQIMNPVGGPGSLRRMGSEASLVFNKEAQTLDTVPRHELEAPPNPLRSNAVYPEQKILKAPEPVKIAAAPAGGHMRKRSYSLFPNNAPANKSSITLLPATTYSPNNNNAKDTSSDHLKPPPSMKNLMSRHRRDSSLVSTATVQIGLRLSSMVDIPPIAKSTVVVPDTNVYHLECPNLQKEKVLSPNKRPAKVNMSLESRPPVARPGTIDDDTLVVDDTPKRDPLKSAKMKTLPPVPRSSEDESDYEADETAVESEVEVLETLSPKVYSPVKSNNNNNNKSTTKLPSPRGVGFGLPSTSYKPGSGAELKSPPMIRRVGTGDTTPVVTEGKAWI